MADTNEFLAVVADSCDWAGEVVSNAVVPSPGSVAAADLDKRGCYMAPQLLSSLVDVLHDSAIGYVASASDFARALIAVVAAPDLSVAVPGGVLTRGAAEAAGYLTHLLKPGSTLEQRLGRMLHLSVVAANFRAKDGPNPNLNRIERDAWREAGEFLGMDSGPKRNFDGFGIGSSQAVELGFGLEDERLTRVLRSYTAASVHSMPTATRRAFRVETANDGRPVPGYDRIPAQEHLYLWATAGAVVMAASHLQRWTSSSPAPEFSRLRDRLRRMVTDI